MTETPTERVDPAWHFLQSELWARHKAAFGWTPAVVPCAVDEASRGGGSVLTLSRRLPGGFLLTYVPYGPALVAAGDSADPAGGSPEGIAEAITELTPRVVDAVGGVTGSRPTLVRFDLPQEVTESAVAELGRAGAIARAPVAVQPPTTVVLDLHPTEDELLASMHKKSRYNIGLAERKGVTIREGSIGEIDLWYAIYRETAQRDAISIHSLEYYRRLLELAAASSKPRVTLSIAEHEGEPIAGIIVVRHGAGATYLYGASSDRKRNLMPNYALQWRAIRDARAAGCEWYDLFGIPPADDPAHPMHGLYRFKVGLGGKIVHRLGAWDVPVRRVSAMAYRAAERVRDRIVHRSSRRVAG